MPNLTKAEKEELRHQPKTNIKQIIVANKRLYRETAQVFHCTSAEIEETISQVHKFIKATMADGKYHTVMIPYFGKFKPKAKYLKALRLTQEERANGMDLFYRAIQGRRLIRNPELIETILPISIDNEAIPDNGRQDHSLEQGMDLPDS